MMAGTTGNRSEGQPIRRWSLSKTRRPPATRIHRCMNTIMMTRPFRRLHSNKPDIGILLSNNKLVIKFINLPHSRTSVGIASCSGLGLLGSEHLLQVAPNNARGLRGINPSPEPLAFVVLHDGASLGVEGSQTFAQRVNVVIGASD